MDEDTDADDTDADDTDADENGEPGADDTTKYDVAESIRSFRRAVARVIDGLEHLYHGGKDRLADQHVVVQTVLTVGLWFAGNWVYNRIAPPIVDLVIRAISHVPTELMLALVVRLLSGNLVLSTTQLLGASTGAILVHNHFQTRRVKKIENNVIAMSCERSTATDGGRPESENIGGAGIGGALAGASIGLSFGPGGVLAGIYLGYVVEERLMRRQFPEDYGEQG